MATFNASNRARKEKEPFLINLTIALIRKFYRRFKEEREVKTKVSFRFGINKVVMEYQTNKPVIAPFESER